MNDLRSRLQKDDPVVREGGLSADERDRMLRYIRTATPDPAAASRRIFLALATALVIVTAGGTLLTHLLVSRGAAVPEATGTAMADPSGPSTVRQLQFSTPGGTRLIWLFNPDFPLR